MSPPQCIRMSFQIGSDIFDEALKSCEDGRFTKKAIETKKKRGPKPDTGAGRISSWASFGWSRHKVPLHIKGDRSYGWSCSILWQLWFQNKITIKHTRMDGWLAILRPFQQYFRTIGGVDNERLCAVELCLRLRRFHLERGSNSVR